MRSNISSGLQPLAANDIHKKPNDLEIAAYLPWLEAELRIVKPAIVVVSGLPLLNPF